MGRRASRSRFAPGHYVFPGGRVDAADYRAQPLTPLRGEVAQRLSATCGPGRARALAVAAVRETYEETGLVLGEIRGGSLLPALDRLDFILRAITPSDWPLRFHARFFIANAEAFTGELRGNGELLDLAWQPINALLKLPLIDVTQFILERLASNPGATYAEPAPLFCFLKGRSRVM